MANEVGGLKQLVAPYNPFSYVLCGCGKGSKAGSDNSSEVTYPLTIKACTEDPF